MKADQFKEMVPVHYGVSGVKLLAEQHGRANQLCFGVHWHERLEILHIINGSLIIRVGDESVTAKAGDVILVNSGQLHAGFGSDTDVDFRTLMFDLTAFQNDTRATKQYLTPLIVGDTVFQNRIIVPEACDAVNTLFDLLQTQSHPLCVVGAVYHLLGVLCRSCAVERGLVKQPDKKFGEVLEYINTHYTDRLTAGSVSRLFNYNESYFCRLFKKASGLTLSAYIRILRMEHAQQLLRNPGVDINTIAEQCGFSDVAYFCRCFREQYSQTPSEYRQRLQ